MNGRLQTGLKIGLILCWALLLAACRQRPVLLPIPTPVTPAFVPTLTAMPLATAEPTPTESPLLVRVGADSAVPVAIVSVAQALVAESALFVWSEAETADLLLMPHQGEPVAEWVYAVVGAFPTLADEVTTADLQARWQAGQLLVDGAMAAFLAEEWGPSAQPAPVADIRGALWQQRPLLGLLPFDELTADLKVLAVAGQSPLATDFVAQDYPFQLTVGVTGEATAVAQFLALWPQRLSNRDAAKLTRVAMTGVTAFVRATAFQMETQGILAPGTAVAPVLQRADIAHISNEVAFAANCPYPDPIGGTTFCSRDSYFELLTELQIDLIELTGNHVNDYGPEQLSRSLDMYEAAGMLTFGGGRNAELAQQPALFTHNGNRIAFMGCNPVGPAYAWAGPNSAGSRPCDEGFYTQISQLRAEGYLVIATLQYFEYYHYAATPAQQEAFRAVAAAGATAVSGSQGHHAQGFAFYEGAFIHYGLGNLFFDQMDMLGTRQTFVDSYLFYDGRLLSVELWTGMIENWCCPREMTTGERLDALTAVFQASDW